LPKRAQMFKKSTTNSQIDFFGNFSMNLDEKRAETLSDPKAWHNQFFEHVTNRIDETTLTFFIMTTWEEAMHLSESYCL